MLVLGYEHPLAIAKRYGTLDRLGGGRLILGVGVGSLREEFELLGAPFNDRGPRADDAIRALRAAMSARQPEYSGHYYRFSGFVIDPHAVQEQVPTWVGGNTSRAVRRATSLADGWAPAAMSPATLRARLDEHPPPHASFEVVVNPDEPLDPSAAPELAEDTIAALADAGATIVAVTVEHRSLLHYRERLVALSELGCFAVAR